MEKKMLFLKIIDKSGSVKASYAGSKINATYEGTLNEGDKIKVILDGCFYIAVKFSPTLKESILYLPNKSFEFIVPSKNQIAGCYAPDSFSGLTHEISVREVEDEEV